MKKTKEKGLQAPTRFIILLTTGLIALVIMIGLSLYFGAETSVTLKDVINGLFHFNENTENFNEIIVRNIRLPRLLADIMVGACLAIAGAVMQGTTKNPMADSGIMGISSGSVFGVVIIMTFLPNIDRLGRIGISCLGAAIVTFLIYAVAMMSKRGMTPDRMVLSGMAISTLFSSVTTALVLKEGTSAEMIKYMAGSSANTIWLDIQIAGPFFIMGTILAIVISRNLTILSLGEEASKGLGANTKLIKLCSTIVVLVLSAIAVVIIGPVSYIGLMIPHIVRYIVGSDYRFVIPGCAILGALFVTIVDFIARMVMPGIEFPIGLVITVIGVPFFIFVSRRQDSKEFSR